MTHTVVGLFNDRKRAQSATEELLKRGFLRENIDVSNRRINNADTKTTEIVISESGVAESISNFFNSLFGSDKAAARNYTNAAGDADAIVSLQVDSPERALEAAEILDRHGAIDVDGQTLQTNAQNFAQTGETPTGNAAVNPNEMRIPVIEEQIQVGKQAVEKGGVRIKSRIIGKPIEANVRLREEHVVVQRRPVNREITQADLANFGEGEIVLTEYSEVPVIGKQARVVEEVVVDKNVTEHVETVRDTVHRQEVEVEEIHNTGAADVAVDNTDSKQTAEKEAV